LVVREAEEALHRALVRSRVVRTVPQGGGLAVSADGTRFATTGADGTAVVWAMGDGERMLILTGHQGAVTDVAFSPDGRLLATAGSDGTVRVWDGEGGAQRRVSRGHRGAAWSVVFSPDGRLLASTGDDGTVRVWDVATGLQARVLTDDAPAERLDAGIRTTPRSARTGLGWRALADTGKPPSGTLPWVS
jgi:WD40 repeat protein